MKNYALIDIIMSADSEITNQDLFNEIQSLITTKETIFLLTDIRWLVALRKWVGEDEYNLKRIFSYHIGSYLTDAQAESPVRYNLVAQYRDKEVASEVLTETGVLYNGLKEEEWKKTFVSDEAEAENDDLDALQEAAESYPDFEGVTIEDAFADWAHKPIEDVCHIDRRKIAEFAAGVE